MAARMQEQVIEPLLALATVKLPAGLLAEHCAASLWSLVAWWLRNDFPKLIEEMGQIFWYLKKQLSLYLAFSGGLMYSCPPI
jgi:hypothetical protein